MAETASNPFTHGEWHNLGYQNKERYSNRMFQNQSYKHTTDAVTAVRVDLQTASSPNAV
jgi:hypothetical protein